MPRILPQLPSETIQSEVLPRLPAKSIGRFRCVCKAWNAFLSTPTFTATQLRYQTNYKLLLLDLPLQSFRTFECGVGSPPNHDSVTTHAIPFKGEEVLVLASLDGLVCVALNKTRELAFWNPATGAYKKFHTGFYNEIQNGAFAFYIDSSNDYKLLPIVFEGAFIYSRRSDSWRKIDIALETSHHNNFKWSMATFVGERVYFKLDSRTRGRLMIVFNVESEKFKEIQFPPPGEASWGVNLVALKGCIHLCVADGDARKGLKCDMWRMEGDGWLKLATFSSPPRKYMYDLKEIHTKRNGNWLAILEDNDSIENIGLEDVLSEFCYLYPRNWSYERKGAIYIETLVSPYP